MLTAVIRLLVFALKADQLEIFEIALSVGMLTIIFAIAGFCEMAGER